ncbi:uncharacterized protein G2W53_018187 [Senna tora]|uniref:Uncharacterized protein n=1 Tax=Senna tora TaxID=362788 RepID=A0A834TQW6_9FABA|nr:uncharacterized protein G2W53_018187 [Senna tora]
MEDNRNKTNHQNRGVDELLGIQGTYDPLQLTDFSVPTGKSVFTGNEGNDRSEKGTLFEQAMVRTNMVGQPAMTFIPSLLGSLSIVTEQYVHDTGQGKSKERKSTIAT